MSTPPKAPRVSDSPSDPSGTTPRRRRLQRRHTWRIAAVVVFVVAGALFVTSGLDAGGLDLRASSVTDLDTVVRQQRERADDLQHEVTRLNRDVDALSESVDDQQVTELQQQVDALKGPAG